MVAFASARHSGAIAAAPTAAADSTSAQPTSGAGAPSRPVPARVARKPNCQSPGNVQVNDAPPQVNYFPLGDS